MTEAGPQQRRRSVPVDVGGVLVGGGAPVVVQSMTNTDTADVEETARQVAALAAAGSEMCIRDRHCNIKSWQCSKRKKCSKRVRSRHVEIQNVASVVESPPRRLLTSGP